MADPDGRARIVASGDARLATAGAGDVLTGMITGRLAAFGPERLIDRVAEAAHLHGRAASAVEGARLIASDLVERPAKRSRRERPQPVGTHCQRSALRHRGQRSAPGRASRRRSPVCGGQGRRLRPRRGHCCPRRAGRGCVLAGSGHDSRGPGGGRGSGERRQRRAGTRYVRGCAPARSQRTGLLPGASATHGGLGRRYRGAGCHAGTHPRHPSQGRHRHAPDGRVARRSPLGHRGPASSRGPAAPRGCVDPSRDRGRPR